MLGIESFNPKFYRKASYFKNDFQKVLKNLIGNKIDTFWLMWNVSQDEWLADGPVVLEINGDRLEFTAYQLDDFSLSINSFELTEKLDWYGMGDEMPLKWKEKANQLLSKNLDKKITAINILQYDFYGNKNESEYILVGIEFVLEKESEIDQKNFFSIYNGLDQNALDDTEVQFNGQIHRIPVN
ncbi:hypothetical protein [Tenacibaculum sp. M341]|uniref:hypothetical protein n=1 Tax=Tenacibaculum sp. M341 TaxID=2530339 RepID=UPI001045DC97|nr:hypothetical protein [Tenacibaculum sp. M341]TCI90674.1 hypothetical protein EYW44_13205 [Tenacibaculum sp. M341]